MKKVTNTKGNAVENCNLTVNKNDVTLSFKLDQNEGLSSSGKSVLVTSSHGEIEISDNTFITFNVYRKLPKEERQKTTKAVPAGKKAKQPEIDPKMLAAIAKALTSMK